MVASTTLLFLTLVAMVTVSMVDAECITTSGPTAGQACLFPFDHKGKTCDGPFCCNLDNDSEGSWCATKEDENGDGNVAVNDYGYCPQSCLPARTSYCPEATGVCWDDADSPPTTLITISGPTDIASCLAKCQEDSDATGCQFDSNDNACKQVKGTVTKGSDTGTAKCLIFSQCKDYLIVSEQKTFEDAETYCTNWGGYLATIPTLEANAVVTGVVGTNTKAWIGKTDVDAQGTFKWVNAGDSSFGSYNNWDNSQPDGDGAGGDGIDCAAIITSGKWSDEDCTETNAFICSRALPVGALEYCPVEAGACAESAAIIDDEVATNPATTTTKEECLALCKAVTDVTGCEYNTDDSTCKYHTNVDINNGDGETTPNTLCWVFDNCVATSGPIDTNLVCNENGFVPTFTYDNSAGKDVSIVVTIGTGDATKCTGNAVALLALDTSKQVGLAEFSATTQIAYKDDSGDVACGGLFAADDTHINYHAPVGIVITETIGSIERKLKYDYQLQCQLKRDAETISTEGAGGKWVIDNVNLEAAAVSKEVAKTFAMGISLKFYTNSDYNVAQTQTFRPKNNEKIYMKVSEDGNGNALFVFTVEECWATAGADAIPTGDDQAAMDAKKDIFLTSQCPVDESVTSFVSNVGTHSYTLELLSFYFTTNAAAEIYFHCRLTICLTSGDCEQSDCSGARKRRSVAGFIESRTITSEQHIILDRTEIFAPNCGEGFVYDRVNKECSNQRLLEVKGVYLDIEWNPLYANTSSKVFRQFAREKEYQLFAMLQATGRDRVIRGLKVIGATKGSVVLNVHIKYADSTYAMHAFREFEDALRTRASTTRVMKILNIRQDKTIEFVPIVATEKPDTEKLVLIVVVVVLFVVVVISGVTLLKVKQIRSTAGNHGNPTAFDNKGVDA